MNPCNRLCCKWWPNIREGLSFVGIVILICLWTLLFYQLGYENGKESPLIVNAYRTVYPNRVYALPYREEVRIDKAYTLYGNENYWIGGYEVEIKR